jgi:hypothetical protein
MINIFIKYPGHAIKKVETMGVDAQKVINSLERIMPAPEVKITAECVNVVFSSGE